MSSASPLSSPTTQPSRIEDFSPGRMELHPKHESFLPNPINKNWTTDDPELHALLDQANRKLGELNASTRLIPEADFFIRMHQAKEALASCSLDGINLTLAETLSGTPETNPSSKGAWIKVRNLIAAQEHSIYSLEKTPLSSLLLKETQAILQGHLPEEKRGKIRSDGTLRHTSSRHLAYTPPHFEQLAQLLGDLKNFIHNPQVQTPHILRAGITFYQFETIKPFPSGNRRLARLLIPLYFAHAKILEKPALFFSDFLDRHRSEYEERLHNARENNDLLGWLKFFTHGINQSANIALETLDHARHLRADIERRLLPQFSPRRREKALKLMLLIYEQPVVNIKLVSKVLEAQVNTATQLIEDFVEMGILTELTGYRRNKLFIFEQYITLFESHNVLVAN